jgi:CRISPR-associated endonuclease Cas3-HD
MPYLARSAKQNSLPQTYLEHVLHVLVRGRCYLRKALYYARDLDKPALLRLLELAAEYHDLGKLDDDNQKVLAGNKRSAQLPLSHADAGVAYLIQQDAWWSAFLVYAHHVGLPDLNDADLGENGMRNVHDYRGGTVVQWVDRFLSEWLERHDASVRSSITPKTACVLPMLRAVDVRILFSCLTHADHGDAARASGKEQRDNPPPKLRANERLESLKQYVQSLALSGKNSDRNHLRSEFFEACSSNGLQENALITICDAPVGTGKTTAIMAYLLGIAAKHGLRRIFVILPFTNIIAQSTEVYRKALVLPGEKGEEIVAEIHHRADFKDKDSRKLTALWDAPIVVTTAVAFFETLASASPATLRRLQNLPGSAVFLDEAHAMLPVKLLPLAWQWIQDMANTWSCRWVLASGSLCHFWELEEFQQKNAFEKLDNILPVEQQRKLQSFEANRIQYKYVQKSMNLDTLAKWLHTLEGPIIVVLNTIHTAAAAAKVAEAVFGEGNILHLSTSLTPEDRSITLKQVQVRLKCKENKKWCLFATSCVEAGVDLSFRTGVRENASLLSLLQFAGRVNRNSETDDAVVFGISLHGHNVVSNPAFEDSSKILADYFMSGRKISPELCTQAMLEEIRRQGNISKTLCDEEKNCAFAMISHEFKVIDDESNLAVVDKNLIEKIQNYEDVSWQDIQRHSVQVRSGTCHKLSIEESKRYPGVFLWNASYSKFLGYMDAVLRLEDLDKNCFAIF